MCMFGYSACSVSPVFCWSTPKSLSFMFEAERMISKSAISYVLSKSLNGSFSIWSISCARMLSFTFLKKGSENTSSAPACYSSLSAWHAPRSVTVKIRRVLAFIGYLFY